MTRRNAQHESIPSQVRRQQALDALRSRDALFAYARKGKIGPTRVGGKRRTLYVPDTIVVASPIGPQVYYRGMLIATYLQTAVEIAPALPLSATFRRSTRNRIALVVNYATTSEYDPSTNVLTLGEGYLKRASNVTPFKFHYLLPYRLHVVQHGDPGYGRTELLP